MIAHVPDVWLQESDSCKRANAEFSSELARGYFDAAVHLRSELEP